MPIDVDIITTASCDNDGTATAIVTNAVEPVSYTWSPPLDTTQTLTGLTEGTYNVTVQDNDGNIASASGVVVSGLHNFLFQANECLREMGNNYITDRSYGREKDCLEKFQLLKNWIDILKCYPVCTEETQAHVDIVFEGSISLILFGFDLFGYPDYYLNDTPNTPLADIVDEINAISPAIVTAELIDISTIRLTYVSGGASNNGLPIIVSRDLAAFELFFAGGDTNQITCEILPCGSDDKCTLIKKIRAMCPQCN